ncbi:unnamed protein product [Prorocentrum cordatum]|uniref:Ubiquitin-like domain-containing protein n=1 Tax=Prorocentrum cordatum TaxID=2364126 RepID=A0ABN9Q898_9DINO|nr:unnamed protein product [Polarella glacialis]
MLNSRSEALRKASEQSRASHEERMQRHATRMSHLQAALEEVRSLAEARQHRLDREAEAFQERREECARKVRRVAQVLSEAFEHVVAIVQEIEQGDQQLRKLAEERRQAEEAAAALSERHSDMKLLQVALGADLCYAQLLRSPPESFSRRDGRSTMCLLASVRGMPARRGCRHRGSSGHPAAGQPQGFPDFARQLPAPSTDGAAGAAASLADGPAAGVAPAAADLSCLAGPLRRPSVGLGRSVLSGSFLPPLTPLAGSGLGAVGPVRGVIGGAPHGDLLPCLPRGRRPSAAAAPGGAGAPRGAAPPGGEDRQDSDVLELEVLQGVSGERLCTVSAQGGWGVGDLKVAVEEKAGIAPGQQRLLVGNEPLSTKMPDLRATLRGKPPVVTLLVGPDPWPALEGALHDTIRGRVQELPESFSFPSLREMSLGSWVCRCARHVWRLQC